MQLAHMGEQRGVGLLRRQQGRGAQRREDRVVGRRDDDRAAAHEIQGHIGRRVGHGLAEPRRGLAGDGGESARDAGGIQDVVARVAVDPRARRSGPARRRGWHCPAHGAGRPLSERPRSAADWWALACNRRPRSACRCCRQGTARRRRYWRHRPRWCRDPRACLATRSSRDPGGWPRDDRHRRSPARRYRPR